MSNHKEDLEQRLSIAAEEEHLWKNFMEQPGWRKLYEVLEIQQRMREKAVTMTPINSVGQAFAQEMYKGEALGIALALRIPQEQLEAAQLERQLVTKELEIEDDAENEVAEGSAGRLDGNPFGEFDTGGVGEPAGDH